MAEYFRARRSRIQGLIVGALAISAALAAGSAGCSLSTEGTFSGDGAPPLACNVAADCDDKEPCTKESCTPDGLCLSQADDTVMLPQKPGDCLKHYCQGGKAAQTNDDKNFQADDNPCTL